MSEKDRSGSPESVPVEVVTVTPAGLSGRTDEIAAEEPLEIRVLVTEGGRVNSHSLSVTMRTPGADRELAAGFLFTEGVVSQPGALAEIVHCGAVPTHAQENVINVSLAPGTPFDPAKFTRNVYTTSSCGVCGKTSLELLRVALPGPPVGDFAIDAETLLSLPARLSGRQAVFSRTGGLHASALFDTDGRLIVAREDVGRHNALDKLVGHMLLKGALPASNTMILVSGRASFELVQKSLMAGIPLLAAVGAPSSLAVDLAAEFDMTLVGFLRDARFNVYSGAHRVVQRA